MFGIVLSALNAALGFVLRGVVMKFGIFFALFFVVTGFISILSSILPDSTAISNALGGVPASVWFFLDLFNVSTGIPILLSAMVTKFVIRRIPVIG